ncbi:GNAT family N-acetyltransferase [uncultured Sphaerotilus sp.]|uniref:GNAT family N-acetyltransferase n=1 Tax=uncultured Sphaerotilus sp. TaxID=474984 RepID=UPI0030CA22EC
MRHPTELTDKDRQAWAALEARAAEPNAFMSPHFVLPALAHLDAGTSAVLMWIERAAGGLKQLAAVGVFRRCVASRVFPWPHLSAYQSEHTYLGGLLVDGESVRPVVESIREFLARPGCFWKGLELPKVDTSGPLAEVVQQLSQQNQLPAQLLGPQERSMLTVAHCGEDLLRESLGKKLNEINRCMRRLAEQGEVRWHCLRKDIPEASIEDFLRLEHLGWKGESGTSMRATPSGEAFFRDMVARFDRDGRALFTELRVDGRAVASTCNFVSGAMGFAFKVGWDPELRKLGPGMLNEVEFIRQIRTHCPELVSFDSGASADSFINRLWPDRRSLGLLLMPSSRLASCALTVTQRLRDSRQARQVNPEIDAIIRQVEA